MGGSIFPRSGRRRWTSGSLPHVAGIAALIAESDPSLRGEKRWKALERLARDLGSIRDFGRGLAQAPLSSRIAKRLEQFGNRWIFHLQPECSARQADLGQASAQSDWPVMNEARPAVQLCSA